MAREVTKEEVLRVRITAREGEMADAIAEDMGTNRSEAVRRLLWEAYKGVQKAKNTPKRRPQPRSGVLEPPATPVSRETGPDAADKLGQAAARLRSIGQGRSAAPVTKAQSAR